MYLANIGLHVMVRTLALTAIELLPDEQRGKLYDSIQDDFYRIRDLKRHRLEAATHETT